MIRGNVRDTNSLEVGSSGCCIGSPARSRISRSLCGEQRLQATTQSTWDVGTHAEAVFPDALSLPTTAGCGMSCDSRLINSFATAM